MKMTTPMTPEETIATQTLLCSIKANLDAITEEIAGVREALAHIEARLAPEYESAPVEESRAWRNCPECNAAPWCEAHKVCALDRERDAAEAARQ